MKKIIYFFMITATVFLFSGCKKESLYDLSDVFYVRYKNAEMPAYVYGNGASKVFVIVLHGGPGGKGLEYRPGALSELESDYAIVYFDQRNSGMSSGSYSSKELTVERMAEDILALVKVIKYKYGNDISLFLLGHSWGGTLGTKVLLMDQTPFKGWIESDGGHNLAQLVDIQLPLFKSVANGQINLGNNLRFWERTLDIVNEVDPVNYTEEDGDRLNSLAFKSESVLLRDGVLETPEGIELHMMTTLFQTDPVTATINGASIGRIMVKENDIWNTIDFTDRLNEITIPALILWGKYDLVIPPVLGEEAYENIGSAEKQFILYEKSGHSPLMNEYKAFAGDVRDFIERYK